MSSPSSVPVRSRSVTTLARTLLGVLALLLVLPTTIPSASAAVATPAATKKAVKAKAAKPFFAGCKHTRRFKERRFDYDVDAVMVGRCVTSRVKGIDLVSSYSGHHPSANKALDIMVNMSGSCRADRVTGNKVARYLMENSGKHGVRYIIWKNSYWASYMPKKKWRNWRHGIAGGSCTTRHYDHVHVAFK